MSNHIHIWCHRSARALETALMGVVDTGAGVEWMSSIPAWIGEDAP